MTIISAAATTYNQAVMFLADGAVLAQGDGHIRDGNPAPGPKGEEFGKASPLGLLIILALLLVILTIGFGMNKRIRRMERRRAFADQHGIDLFDTEKLEAKMREEGYTDMRAKDSMYARTEVPVTDERFQPASGVLTGPEAIEAERNARATGGDASAPNAPAEEPSQPKDS